MRISIVSQLRKQSRQAGRHNGACPVVPRWLQCPLVGARSVSSCSLVAGAHRPGLDGSPVRSRRPEAPSRSTASMRRVTVIRDDHGIPQIYADTTDDLFFAQGYVQAQDRFFEMDFRRHVTAGPAQRALRRGRARDRQVRPHAWAGARVAEQELPLLSTDTRALPRALLRRASTPTSQTTTGLEHLAGVRRAGSRLASTPRPRSGHRSTPRPGSRRWPGTSAATSTTRSTGRSMSTRLTREQIAQLFPAYPYDENQPIVTQGAIVDGVYEQNARGNGTRLPERPRYRDPDGRARRCCERRRATRRPRRAARRHRRRTRIQRLGSLGRAHGQRCAHPRQRPASGRVHAERLVPDGPALHRGRCRLSRSTSAASRSPAFRAW